MKKALNTLCAAATLMASGMVVAAPGDITGNIIMGTGMANGDFTIGTGLGGIEVGLRARERYPSPTNETHRVGDSNVYQHAAGGFESDGTPGGPRAAWNFDWSINVGDGNSFIDDLSYTIGIDFDPTAGTDYKIFDVIKLPCADHSFGTNSTAPGAGTEVPGAGTPGVCTTQGDLDAYAALRAGNNLAQNSWNLAFFTDADFSFDPTVDGLYSIYLRVSRGDVAVAESSILVQVGDAPGSVPEPGSLALAGLALLGVAAQRRRQAAARGA